MDSIPTAIAALFAFYAIIGLVMWWLVTRAPVVPDVDEYGEPARFDPTRIHPTTNEGE